MLPFIAVYLAGFVITLEITLIFNFVDEKTAPVLTSLVTSFTWPMFAAWYVWVGIQRFVAHMVQEFTGG